MVVGGGGQYGLLGGAGSCHNHSIGGNIGHFCMPGGVGPNDPHGAGFECLSFEPHEDVNKIDTLLKCSFNKE